MKPFTIAVIIIGVLSGVCLTLLSARWQPGSTPNILLLTLGTGIISTAFISIILDLFWSKERAKAEKEELQPLYEKFNDFANKLSKLEGRLEAFKQLGFNYCFASRTNALERFYVYATEIISGHNVPHTYNSDDSPSVNTINIVSSSARGLVGYLDRDPHEVQKNWRDLITANPKSFRILLTHPAYAHLRQPAEERSSGDIELEILKTAIYLHCVAGMSGSELRFYRGSPTVFSIQASNHIFVKSISLWKNGNGYTLS